MENPMNLSIRGRVTHTGTVGSVRNAEVRLVALPTGPAKREREIARVLTDMDGRFIFEGAQIASPGEYVVRCVAFGKSVDHKVTVTEESPEVSIALPIELRLSPLMHNPEQATLLPAVRAVVGRHLIVRAEIGGDAQYQAVRWTQPFAAGLVETSPGEVELMFSRMGKAVLEAVLVDREPNFQGTYAEALAMHVMNISEPEVQTIAGHIGVTMERTKSDSTLDQALWVAIRNRSHALSFQNYRRFLDRILAWDESQKLPEQMEWRLRELGAHMHGVTAYQLLKFATETFLLLECGVRMEHVDSGAVPFDSQEELSRLGERFTRPQMEAKLAEYLGKPPQLPYITRVIETAFPDYERCGTPRDRVLGARLNEPCLLELIWNYWLEEGMLMQTLSAVSLRFQNVRTGSGRDPLGNMEIDPLRPLNNLLWGYVQDEVNRLSVKRRAYEYSHQYGLALFGRATPGLRAADNRSKFLEGFHKLLAQVSIFYDKDFQTTIIADGFPVLNSLQEVHLILAQGAHNQFGDMPWTARVEMLLAQYILARPEIRDFLQSRAMVPYKEAWMPQVDTMKQVQDWTDVSVTYFRDLAVYGEQLLLSIRYADWIRVNDEDAAKNWARYWRPEIQGYIHAYRAVTGVDLSNTARVDATLPAIHLRNRLAQQQQQRAR